MNESLFYIFLYGLIFVILLLYIVLVYNRKNIINNWDNYKCNPLVMPFASVFDKDPVENLNGCMWNGYKSNFSILIKPFTYMIDTIKLVIGKLFEQLNSIRTMLKPIRDFVESATAMVYKKIEGIMNLTMFTFLKMNNLMKRTFANFRLMVYALEASQYTIQSTWNGPIGQITRFWAPGVDFFSDFFCFDPSTKVLNINKVPVQISNLNIGDLLFHNNKIIGILNMIGVDNYYNYNGIIVSGNHLVYNYQNRKWSEVSNAPNAKYIYKPEIKNVICLITENNTIPIIDRLGAIHHFADYLETTDDAVMKYQRSLIYKNLSIPSYEISTCYNLIDSNCLIHINDDKFIKISNIKIGDHLYNNSIVVGVIKQHVDEISVVYIDNIMYTFSNIIFYNDHWQTIKILENSSNVTKYSGIMYNLITTKGFYKTDKFIVRDYLELHSSEIYDDVREYTIKILNSRNI
jgi:hypothetical protein